MADSVLTSLCTICHVGQPKYKCPRCNTKTCSLACIKKHKAWASCSGVRNAAAYVPLSSLRTDAGIDHDYNFLSGIERSMERSDKELVEERGLMTQAELRPQNDEQSFEKVWVGEQLHWVPRKPEDRRLPRHLMYKQRDNENAVEKVLGKYGRRRLKELDIRVTTMPQGSSRRKENSTSWNTRSRAINWQVEWLVYSQPGASSSSPHEEKLDPPRRLFDKMLDCKSLEHGLVKSIQSHETAEYHKRAREEDGDEGSQYGPLRKRQRYQKKKASQASHMDTWPSTPYCMQSYTRGTWDQVSTRAALPETVEDGFTSWRRHRFFFLQQGTPSNRPKVLIPLDATATLADSLSGWTIIEYPTIYVLPAGTSLPDHHTLGSLERRKRPPRRVFEPRPGREPAGRGSRAPQPQRTAPSRHPKAVTFAVSDEPEEGEVESQDDVRDEAVAVSDGEISEASEDDEDDVAEGSRSGDVQAKSEPNGSASGERAPPQSAILDVRDTSRLLVAYDSGSGSGSDSDG